MRKYLVSAMLAVSMMAATGCESHREIQGHHVSCLGLDDLNRRDPAYDYELSTLNVIMGILFVEMLIPPIIVALDETYCPVERSLPREALPAAGDAGAR